LHPGAGNGDKLPAEKEPVVSVFERREATGKSAGTRIRFDVFIDAVNVRLGLFPGKHVVPKLTGTFEGPKKHAAYGAHE
jgi:hypothetical protein